MQTLHQCRGSHDRTGYALAVIALIAFGCSSGNGGNDIETPNDASTDSGYSGNVDSGPPKTYSVGGSISGLAGTGLVLQNNGGDDVTVAADATSFVFATKLAPQTDYAVTVLTQPTSPAQDCIVANASGTITAGNIANITVSCETTSFTVGGTISGLGSATGLVLQNNGGDDLTVPADATDFSFATALMSGDMYEVRISAQPAGRICKVESGSTGSVASTNVTDVVVSCAPAGSQTFDYTGSMQVFTVPEGVTSIKIEAWGARAEQVKLAAA